jgi:Flp pilus assembly pilin Flp
MIHDHRPPSGRSAEPDSAQGGSAVWRAVGRFCRQTSAVTSVEYAVMLALILGIMLAAIHLLSIQNRALWVNNNIQLQRTNVAN